ncbi:MAG: hypothetical protein HYT47_00610 [Candidatus Vogelbacteria bacterium]|nr:hypothetical protein [Candidatus Vogelbacteria bacterium]
MTLTDVWFGNLVRLDQIITQLQTELERNQSNKSRLLADLGARIREGHNSTRPNRDFAFLKLGGTGKTGEIQVFEHWLDDLHRAIAAHPSQLALVVNDEPYKPYRGGVMSEHHLGWLSRTEPEPDKKRIIRLCRLAGGELIFDFRQTNCALPCPRFLKRVSLATFGDKETKSFESQIEDGHCPIEFCNRFGVSERLHSLISSLPFDLPEIVIGDEAVSQWMEKYGFLQQLDSVPSPFSRWRMVLDDRPGVIEPASTPV